MAQPGAIYLVGTGPGDPGLITVRGLALIREADAIVGDLLSQTAIRSETAPTVEWYDVGCRTSQSKISQAEISQLLIRLARQGKMVVRLWPGDPFIFGRAAQEISQARQAGLRVELVPGISSALAAPAYAGVPVTDWDYNTSFAVVTGYESKNPQVKTDWPALAKVETLVILMPLDDLSGLVDRLVAAGRPPDTPALVVQHATLPQQRQVLATLGGLVEAVAAHQIGNPAIVVVGPVAALANELAWFKPGSNQPLRGKRVLVTRPAHQAAELMQALRQLGADPLPFPTIEIEAVDDSTALDQAITAIGRSAAAQRTWLKQPSAPPPLPPYDWLVFTSVNGVAAFWERLSAAGQDSRSLSLIRIAAIGPATAAALAQRSIVPDLVPPVYTAEGVLAALAERGPLGGQRFLLARADIARQALPQGLRDNGAIVEEIAVYRTVPRAGGPRPPAADIITFTSSSTVQGFVNCLGEVAPADFLREQQVICIGPITAQTAQELGLPVTAVAESYTIEGLLQALVAA